MPGYGHVVPKTDLGRVATIIYAFIGIPLLLMVLTDFGKLFTRAIKFVFKYCRKIYYTSHLRKVRSVGRKATKRLPTQVCHLFVTQYMTTDCFQYMTAAFERLNQFSKEDKDKEDKSKSTHLKPEDRQSKSRSRSSSPAKESRPTSVALSNATTSKVGDETASTLVEDPTDFEVDDEFNLPISVAVILLLLYMMIGAAFFTVRQCTEFSQIKRHGGLSVS